MSFFLRTRSGGGKRDNRGSKKNGSSSEVKSKKQKLSTNSRKPKKVQEDEISSEEDEDIFNDAKNARYKEVDDDDYEDVQTTAYREAKALLEKVKDTEEATDEDEDTAIAHRLIKNAQVKLGVLHRKIADKIVFDESVTHSYRPHRFSPISIAVSKNSRFIVSCSKDGSVVKYDLQENKKVGTIKHSKTSKNYHQGHILAVAISPDDQYLVTGGADKSIKVWKFDTFDFVQNLGTHRGAVTSLVFRQSGALEMYSGSTDRSIKAWNLDQMGFVDIMFGHQDAILQLDMSNKPRVLSCGGQDRTVRLFKVMEESQLVFNGFSDCISIDTVAFIDDDHFVSGSADGSVCAWASFKKKPLSVVKEAHGRNSQTSISSMKSETPQHSKGGLRSKMREKAEKWLHVKPGRKSSSDNFHESSSMANFPMHHHSDKNSLSTEVVRHRNSFAAPTTPSIVSQNTNLVSIPLSRPTSIASSSGFASLGSQNVNSALNEQTSPEYLLKVVEHLRKELHQKEHKIKDLQDYLDKLLSRVIEKHPDMLQVNDCRR